MIAAAFLACALALPAAGARLDLGRGDVEVVRTLRDWPNGHTASRAASQVFIFGPHQNWVILLNAYGVKTWGMWREKNDWPYFTHQTGSPHRTEFGIFHFQIYLFDDKEQFHAPLTSIVMEASRLVRPMGFFLFRKRLCPSMGKLMDRFGWDDMKFAFHDFSIWHRRKYFEDVRMAA